MHISQISAPLEINTCAEIWLKASILAHDFIAPELWQNNLSTMKEQYLPASTLYAAKEQSVIVGFAAVHQDSLAALFVSPEWWGNNIGSQLLHHVQMLHSRLHLSVYVKNHRAIHFYQKHGFCLLREQVCQHTGEHELHLSWKK